MTLTTDSAFFELVYHSILDIQLLDSKIVLGKIFDQ